MTNFHSLGYFIPEIVLFLTALALLIISVVNQLSLRLEKFAVGASLCLALLALGLIRPTVSHGIFSNLLVWDAYGQFIKICSIIITIFIFIIYLHEQNHTTVTELCFVFLILVVAIFIAVSANHLLVLFLAIQIINIAGFLLAHFPDSSRKNDAVGWHDLIFSLTAGLVMLMGITIIYGTTGTFFIAETGRILRTGADLNISLIIGFVMVMFGFIHTISGVFRLHWTVKINRNLPVCSRLLLTTLPQFAEIAALIRLLNSGFGAISDPQPIFLAVGLSAGMTVIYPIFWDVKEHKSIDPVNVASLSQTGFSLLALCTLTLSGYVAAVFYQIAFIGCLIALATGELLTIQGEKRPGQIVILASLIGVPLTAGFSAKFIVFSNLVRPHAGYYFLIGTGLISYVLMFIGYGRVIRQCTVESDRSVLTPLKGERLIFSIRVLILLSLICGGIFWTPLTDYIRAVMIFGVP